VNKVIGAPPKPTKAELLAAVDQTVPDVIGPGLKVLFCGINPGLWTAAVGHHFARPGNRFWPALHAGGFTPRLLAPHEEKELLQWGYGITNLVARTTARADQLREEEFAAGGKRLAAKVRRYHPKVLALLWASRRNIWARPKCGCCPIPAA
jgi:TDG/mug DNA glycosylase family protein